jgi:flagellar hook assembly protein FlgD
LVRDHPTLATIAPNPFNATTAIAYTVPATVRVSLKIYDVAGRLTATLVNGSKPRGSYVVPWDGLTQSGTPAASGVYFVRFTAQGARQTQKLILLR